MKAVARWLVSYLAILCFSVALASATETITYQYDALGRLVEVQSSGTVNDGQNVKTTFDAAGNRTSYVVIGAGIAPAALAIGNASVTEGGNLVFTVTRSGNTAIAASANYASASGTATSGSDFTAVSGTVSFAAGETSKTITVATIDDSAVEATETLTVTLSSPSANTTIATASGAGTINDNDAAILAIGNATATEGGSLSFIVTRSGNTATAASANYATASGTATSGSDFTAASGTVSFAAGETSKTITVATIDDSVAESSETLTVTLSSPSVDALIATATGTGTINDNDAALANLAIADASVNENNNKIQFTVTRSGNTAIAASASYATASGTATSGSDFVAASGTVSFNAGQTSRPIEVTITNDSVAEVPETFTVTLSNPSSGAAITTAVGTGTINDDDVGLAISNASATEGGTLTFTVTRIGKTSSNTNANYSTANGTAIAGSDYTAASGSLNFASGETSKTINISTIDDAVVESAETMTVTITSGAQTILITPTGTGTINDNDAATNAILAIGNASVTEGGTLSFAVTRSGNTAIAASANYASASGTATAGSDFTATSGTVSFAAGETSKTITVATTDDAAAESAETMTITLSSPSVDTVIATAVGTGTINDNETVEIAYLAISAASVTEGGVLNFVVTRSGNNGIAASASYVTASGTATSGSDFTAASGTVSFAAGETTKTIAVATIDDSSVESAETLTVTLSSPSANTAITTATATGTINDNDVTPASLAIGNAAVTEGGTLNFTVTRSGNTSIAASASYATAGGTATSGSDFTAASGTVSFASGETTKTISITTIDDSSFESTETMTVVLSSPGSNTTITTSVGTGTINDNDGTTPIALTDSSLNVLTAHSPLYTCANNVPILINIPPYGNATVYLTFCTVSMSGNSVTVYDGSNLDPGYSISGGILYVLPSYYGMGAF